MAVKFSKILVSQPEPAIKERSPFYEFATKSGVEIDYHPLIKVEGVSLKEFRTQRVDVLEHTVVIFTSRTTVDSYFNLCEGNRVTVPDGMKYICQTEAVAHYLQKYIVYRKRKISFADGSFNGLVELIVKNRGEKFLLTLTDPHKPELPEAMTKLGLDFTDVILAHTVSTDMSGFEIKDFDLVALYSPSDVKALCEGYKLEELPIVSVFGRATMSAAIEAGLHVKAMAPTATAPSMAKAVELLAAKLKQGVEIADIELEDDKTQEEFLKSQQSKLSKRPRGVRNSLAK